METYAYFQDIQIPLETYNDSLQFANVMQDSLKDSQDSPQIQILIRLYIYMYLV